MSITLSVVVWRSALCVCRAYCVYHVSCFSQCGVYLVLLGGGGGGGNLADCLSLN